MNRLSSHRIVRGCSEHRCKGFRRVSGVNLVLEGTLLRPAHGAQRIAEEVRRRTRIAAEAGHSAAAQPAALTPPRKRRISPGSVRAAMILKGPPQAAHALTWAANPRASRAAHPSR